MLGHYHAGTGLVKDLFDCQKICLFSPNVWLILMCSEWLFRTWEDLPRETLIQTVFLVPASKVGLPRVLALLWLYRQLPSL